MPRTNINDISSQSQSNKKTEVNLSEIQKRFEKLEVRQKESSKMTDVNWPKLNAVVIKI